ncbi:hypothetical protein M3Y97_00335200 [Aphelenchoides bicaudatus]|nr:hypothetical protein M3Y97_00335200 [Aphelenchoides bicaudatus]
MSEKAEPIKQSTSEFYVMTRDEFLEPITDLYAKNLSELPVEDLVDKYNPGATKEDGSINFECHCMSHMVGSPCGYEFRQAMSCQRNAGDDAEPGVCADEFVEFMKCVIDTKCFKKTEDLGDSEFDEPRE